MLLISYIAWNMAADESRTGRKKRLHKHEFHAALAEEMLAFSEMDVEKAYENELGLPAGEVEDRDEVSTPEPTVCHLADYNWIKNGKLRPHCAVCKLESNLRERAKYSKMSSRSQRALAYYGLCKLSAHTSVNETSKLHKIPELSGKTCYEIMHSNFCNGLWSIGKRRTVSTKHHVYKMLLDKYNIPRKKGSRLGIGKVVGE